MLKPAMVSLVLLGVAACAGGEPAVTEPDLVLSERATAITREYLSLAGGGGALAVSRDGRTAGYSYCASRIRTACRGNYRNAARRVCQSQGAGSCVDVLVGNQVVYAGRLQTPGATFGPGERLSGL